MNIEESIPNDKVIANPFIGPDPIKDKTKAVSNVVILASKIVSKALLYPFLINVISIHHY